MGFETPKDSVGKEDNVVFFDQFQAARDSKKIERLRKELRAEFAAPDYIEEEEEPEED